MSALWNSFVAESRNATFLLNRAYMDYHSDRFADCSWIALKKGKPVTMLPANITSDGVLHSHGGLTYGGWILPPAHLDGADLLEIFRLAACKWKSEGLSALDYKTIPYIYWKRPSAEDEYALFRMGATLAERNLSATIDYSNPGRLNKLQRRHLAKAAEEVMEIKEIADSEGIEQFMNVLARCLDERHGAIPVHNSAEMLMLRNNFPANIRFHVVLLGGEIHAGVCIYDTGQVAHCQYIATTATGRERNLLTPLFNKLINEVYAKKRFFDFGISNEAHGMILNEGLLRQKYSYGATGTVYSRYLLKL